MRFAAHSWLASATLMCSGTVSAGLGFRAATVPFVAVRLARFPGRPLCVVDIVRLRASSDSIFLRMACTVVSRQCRQRGQGLVRREPPARRTSSRLVCLRRVSDWKPDTVDMGDVATVLLAALLANELGRAGVRAKGDGARSRESWMAGNAWGPGEIGRVLWDGTGMRDMQRAESSKLGDQPKLSQLAFVRVCAAPPKHMASEPPKSITIPCNNIYVKITAQTHGRLLQE